MPVDSQGNFGVYSDAPPYWARGRKGYRKWVRQNPEMRKFLRRMKAVSK